MRRKLTVIWFLLIMLIFSACANVDHQMPQNTTTTNKNPINLETSVDTRPFTEIKENSCKLILDTDLLETAKKGQLKGVKVNLSSSKNNLEESYGKPDHIGFENAEYLRYDNCYFYIWNENQIGVIDIKINFSVEEVKKVLGKPDFEGNPDAGFDEYALGYKADEYYLYFKYQNKESTTGVFRFKKPQ